uniref:Uncharacterized protein n=1 Tax=Tanacetum cinerariifolium TaxID=118510 RepID=A0A6L2JXB0_TANCI|nr:hypothetical protein [Tanacetum cinerariifolium]
MWETNSYKAHEDHMMLYEALEKSTNHDNTDDLLKDLAEARKKKKKRRDSPKTPPGSPPHQSHPPPPPAGLFGTSGSPRASGSSQVPPPPPSPLSTNQKGQSHGSTAPSSSKTAASAKYKSWTTTDTILRLKTGESHLRKTDLLHQYLPSPFHHLTYLSQRTTGHVLCLSTYSPPLEDSLLAQIDDMAMFIDWFCKRQRITELKPQDLEGPVFELVKVFHPNTHIWGDRRAVRTHILILSVVRIEVFSMYGQRVEDLQLGIESYQTQLNLTKPRWDATGFEYKHDYTVIDSPRAFTFRDKYGVQMIMRFNEIHKFSDGTLHKIDEALDYRVKEFKVNRMNPGLNTSPCGFLGNNTTLGFANFGPQSLYFLHFDAFLTLAGL